MTQNEVMALIRNRITDAEYKEQIEILKKQTKNASYYRGLQEGLAMANQIIGMLGNHHNRLKSGK
jgi:hypothetical protein